ncbi:MAG: MiaB/RimO family radical SAM methylthiotransferase [Planctomycetota bacterium]|jgi:tRNA-2-methylthio-N6-dimethylallyladenosine synthase
MNPLMDAGEHHAESVGRRVYLETFGCQMNELDSELVRGRMAALGYTFTSDPHQADVVLYNTCSVREHAENKVLSRVGRVGRWKHHGLPVVLGVLGCLAEREGEALLTKYPQIDLLCGPGELDKLPLLIDNALKTGAVERAERVALAGNRSRRSAVLSAAADNLELLDLSRSLDPDRDGSGEPRWSAYVRITRGCNKYCTYCVVPFTRGAEVHRPPDNIVDECKRLADHGVIEITLLGQTVNHYVYTHGVSWGVGGTEAPQVGPGGAAFAGRGAAASRAADAGCARAGRRVTTFADLLKRIHDEVPAVGRLRFVTSYPRDFGNDVLEVMAASPRICRYLHVPGQSGSDRILKLMNRGYTRQQYVEFVERARSFLPDVSMAGDIIVGFPTETEVDFDMTRELMRQVRFKNHFIFKYSPRPGTTADDRLPDDVGEAVKRRRNNELLALQADISASVHAEQVGRVVGVFVEGVSCKSARIDNGRVEVRWQEPSVQMSGRTAGDLITVFTLPAGLRPQDLVGRIVPVEVTGSGPLILRGRLDRGVESRSVPEHMGRAGTAAVQIDDR